MTPSPSRGRASEQPRASGARIALLAADLESPVAPRGKAFRDECLVNRKGLGARTLELGGFVEGERLLASGFALEERHRTLVRHFRAAVWRAHGELTDDLLPEHALARRHREGAAILVV